MRAADGCDINVGQVLNICQIFTLNITNGEEGAKDWSH